jgi:hypothetical protein
MQRIGEWLMADEYSGTDEWDVDHADKYNR